ncbi:MAG: rhodanese-related sulfurtransferase [Candidatus Woesearchaeota archaeon]|nr:rhodanese-related sulfurtransferase [Candidatus Woesearchaeota archaeon]
MKNILYYKYTELANLEVLKEELIKKGTELGLLGKILIAEEGINGCVSGTDEDINAFKAWLTAKKEFADMAFKEGKTEDHTFKRFKVKIRKEIVSLREESTALHDKADYIEPAELKTLLDNNEEVILVDARNNYESTIGKFANAITPDIEFFSQWPDAVKKLQAFKEKPIVTYCTGGIRCEKASAYMKEQGFTNVKQLHGGIIRYGEACGDAHWEGKCFVFDSRGAIDIDPSKESEHITQCTMCNLPCSKYHNCALVDCDKMFIACEKCTNTLEHCCSKLCRGSRGRKVVSR